MIYKDYKINTININNKLISIKDMFTNINASPLLKKRLEEVRSAFRKKYNTRFMQIFVLNENNTKAIQSIESELWNDFLWGNYLNNICNIFFRSQTNYFPSTCICLNPVFINK